MPNWGNWITDCSNLLNWFIYYGAMVVVIFIYIALFVFSCYVGYNKGREAYYKSRTKKLDKEWEKISRNA